ncbi:MAG: hypothetical protein E7273_14000 [Pseudobutyrivibrio ruminis]|nr:hypothetical protein [Pseudobutyrivibrio ruminis]
MEHYHYSTICIIKRLLCFLIGLLILATGVSVSTITGLGISPLNVIPFVLSQISGIQMGYMTMALFAVYILIEVAIKGKQFRMWDFLQFICAVIFGYFINWTKSQISIFSVENYAVKVLITLLSAFLIALGTQVYVSAHIVPQATEGLILAICDKWSLSFAVVKEWFDVISVILAAIISLIFTGTIIGIREGTLIIALLVGVIVGFLARHFTGWLEKKVFGTEPIPGRKG